MLGARFLVDGGADFDPGFAMPISADDFELDRHDDGLEPTRQHFGLRKGRRAYLLHCFAF